MRQLRGSTSGGLDGGAVQHSFGGPEHVSSSLTEADRFTAFVATTEPKLRRALAGALGTDRANDAVASALTWAWENWVDVEHMENAAGYLYRVGRSSARVRPLKRVRFLVRDHVHLPEVEPGLPAALACLTPPQRQAVWLVHACQWTYAETAEAMGISTSAVGTHLRRGLDKLRTELGATDE